MTMVTFYSLLTMRDEHMDDAMSSHTQPATYIHTYIGTSNFVIVTIMWGSLRLTPNTN